MTRNEIIKATAIQGGGLTTVLTNLENVDLSPRLPNSTVLQAKACTDWWTITHCSI